MINIKNGLHRIFILLAMTLFVISLFEYLNSDCDLIFKIIMPFIVSASIYFSYWVGLWVVNGFFDKKEFNNKGLIVVLILLLFFFIGCTIFLANLNYKHEKEYRKIELEYAKYRTTMEGNYSGWTLEEIKDLFNNKK